MTFSVAFFSSRFATFSRNFLKVQFLSQRRSLRRWQSARTQPWRKSQLNKLSHLTRNQFFTFFLSDNFFFILILLINFELTLLALNSNSFKIFYLAKRLSSLFTCNHKLFFIIVGTRKVKFNYETALRAHTLSLEFRVNNLFFFVSPQNPVMQEAMVHYATVGLLVSACALDGFRR